MWWSQVSTCSTTAHTDGRRTRQETVTRTATAEYQITAGRYAATKTSSNKTNNLHIYSIKQGTMVQSKRGDTEQGAAAAFPARSCWKQ